MGSVLRALADPTRRGLLERLLERDGQTVTELCADPVMTRFGVMKHLRVLEAAGLVTTRRRGREKLHYLNPMPIRLLHRGWIARLANLPGHPVGDGRPEIADEGASRPRRANQVPASSRRQGRIRIRTTPERLWDAIAQPGFTRDRLHGMLAVAARAEAVPARHPGPAGDTTSGRARVEYEPPRRLVHTCWAPRDGIVTPDPTHRMTWTIRAIGELCELTVEEDDWTGALATSQAEDRPMAFLAGLKTALETGPPLPSGGSQGPP